MVDWEAQGLWGSGGEVGTPIGQHLQRQEAGDREGRPRRDGATAPGIPSLGLGFPMCTGWGCPELGAASWPTCPRTSSPVLSTASTSRARWVWLRLAPQTAGHLGITSEGAAHLDSEVVGLQRKPGAAWVPGGALPPTLPEPFMGICRAGRPLRFWGAQEPHQVPHVWGTWTRPPTTVETAEKWGSSVLPAPHPPPTSVEKRWLWVR